MVIFVIHHLGISVLKQKCRPPVGFHPEKVLFPFDCACLLKRRQAQSKEKTPRFRKENQ